MITGNTTPTEGFREPPIQTYGWKIVEPVMTLRDYFAAVAIQGMCKLLWVDNPAVADQTAATAYMYADAMLKERERGE